MLAKLQIECISPILTNVRAHWKFIFRISVYVCVAPLKRNRQKRNRKHTNFFLVALVNNMGAKDSKPSCISYEDAIKRGKCEIVYIRIDTTTNMTNKHTSKRSKEEKNRIRLNHQQCSRVYCRRHEQPLKGLNSTQKIIAKQQSSNHTIFKTALRKLQTCFDSGFQRQSFMASITWIELKLCERELNSNSYNGHRKMSVNSFDSTEKKKTKTARQRQRDKKNPRSHSQSGQRFNSVNLRFDVCFDSCMCSFFFSYIFFYFHFLFSSFLSPASIRWIFFN